MTTTRSAGWTPKVTTSPSSCGAVAPAGVAILLASPGGGRSTIGGRMSENVHTRIQDAFSSYLEGDLAEKDRQRVDEHLATCIQCRTELERFRTTLGRLGGLHEKAPKSFLGDIEGQIRARSRGRFFSGPRRLFGRVPYEWVSLAMIVAMLVYYIFTRLADPTGVTPSP